MPLTVEWSEEEVRALIDERKRRNADFHLVFGRSKVKFWEEVAKKIEEDTGTNFTGSQCRDKFKNVVRDCKLFHLYEKGEPKGRWSKVGEVFGEEFRTPFWERPPSRVDENRLANLERRAARQNSSRRSSSSPPRESAPHTSTQRSASPSTQDSTYHQPSRHSSTSLPPRRRSSSSPPTRRSSSFPPPQ